MALVMIHQSRRTSFLDEIEENTTHEDKEEQEVLRHNSNTDRIEAAFQLYKSRAAGLMKEHDPDRMSPEMLEEIVRDKHDRFLGCLSLPFTFAFFVIFAMSTILHGDITNAYLIESGLRDVLANGANDVENIPAVWSWMENHFIPSFFGANNEVNHTDKDIWRPVLTYNRLVGPILMKTIRSKKERCTKEGFTDMMCYSMDELDSTTYGREAPSIMAPWPHEYKGGRVSLQQRKDYWDSAFIVDAEKSHFSQNRRLREHTSDAIGINPLPKSETNTFTATIFPNVLRSTAMEQLNYIKQRGWLDEQTVTFSIRAALLNAEVGRPRLTQFTLDFSFSRAGGIFASTKVNTIILQFWQSMLSAGSISDAIFFIGLVAMTVLQVRPLAGKDPDKWKKCRSGWSLLQWAIIVFGWFCVLGHGVNFSMSNTLIPVYKDVLEAQNKDMPAETNTHGELLHSKMESVNYFNQQTKFIFSMYHLLLMMRFFTAFDAQPRLGVVTKTLEVSLIDILHFLVIWVPTFVSFSVSGCFIFGKRVEEFSNIQISIGTCFKIFMESEYDWPVLSEDYFFTSFFWVFSFMLLLVMVMLNMVLAIVLDVYTEIRKRSGNSEPVWVTVYHMLQQMYHFRNWISTAELLDRIPKLPPVVGRAQMRAAYPTMCEEQLEQIFAAANYHMLVMESGNEQDARKITLAVKIVMDDIASKMTELDNGVCNNDSFDVSSEGWMPVLAKEMALQNHMMLSLQWSLQQIEWQWEAMDVIHGQHASFPGQHKLQHSAARMVY